MGKRKSVKSETAVNVEQTTDSAAPAEVTASQAVTVTAEQPAAPESQAPEQTPEQAPESALTGFEVTAEQPEQEEQPASEEQPEQEEQPAKPFADQLISALCARNAEVYSRDTELAIVAARQGKVALNRIMSAGPFAEIADSLVAQCRIARDVDAGKANYIAVKVLVKLVRTLIAMSAGLSSYLDNYTRSIGANLCKLNGINAGLTNKSALVCLSKSIEYDALDQVQDIVRKITCQPGTASTQASSSRMCLHYLDIAHVNKAKQGDITTLKSNERAARFIAMFTVKVISEETQS